MFSGIPFGSLESTAYVYFDLSRIPSSLILSATLELKAGCHGGQTDVTGNTHSIHTTSLNWNETSLSGTKLPGITKCPSLPTDIEYVGTYQVDAHGIFKAAVTYAVVHSETSGDGAISFAITFKGPQTSPGTSFCVRSSLPESVRPKLVVNIRRLKKRE